MISEPRSRPPALWTHPQVRAAAFPLRAAASPSKPAGAAQRPAGTWGAQNGRGDGGGGVGAAGARRARPGGGCLRPGGQRRAAGPGRGRRRGGAGAARRARPPRRASITPRPDPGTPGSRWRPGSCRRQQEERGFREASPLRMQWRRQLLPRGKTAAALRLQPSDSLDPRSQ